MNVLLFGATGQLGRHIARELKSQKYSVTVAVRDPARARRLSLPYDQMVTCNFSDDTGIASVIKEHDVIISALGKSVSPSERSAASFEDVDLRLNRIILKHALDKKVSRFVYISAFHAEKYPNLEYFRVHEQFAKELRQSGLTYSIIKPVSLFSAYLEMIPMARKGLLFNIGKGDKRTNPVFDGDVANVAVGSIALSNTEVEVGGGTTYSRAEITGLIQRYANPRRKVRTLPAGLLKGALPLIRAFDRNTYDKLAFFSAVMETDTIAPAVGKADFENFIQDAVGHQSRSSG